MHIPSTCLKQEYKRWSGRPRPRPAINQKFRRDCFLLFSRPCFKSLPSLAVSPPPLKRAHLREMGLPYHNPRGHAFRLAGRQWLVAAVPYLHQPAPSIADGLSKSNRGVPPQQNCQFDERIFFHFRIGFPRKDFCLPLL